MPKTQLLSKSYVLGLTKRIFWFGFFQKALFGFKTWKQTGTKMGIKIVGMNHRIKNKKIIKNKKRETAELESSFKGNL